MIEHDGERNRELVDEVLYVARTQFLVTLIDGHDLETLCVTLPVEAGQLGKFLAARGAPGAPERHDDWMTPQCRQLKARAGERADIDLRRRGSGGQLCARGGRRERDREEYARGERDLHDDLRVYSTVSRASGSFAIDPDAYTRWE